MNTQQIQNTLKNGQRTIGKYWLWLSLSIVLLVAALAVNDSNRPALIVPDTGSPVKAQTVPDAAAQGVEDYIGAHSSVFSQAVLDASAQSVANYLRAHSAKLPGTTVIDPAAQSVLDYLNLHSNALEMQHQP